MARVNIDDRAYCDVRFKKIATRVNLDWYSVLCRMTEVWRYCTEFNSPFITEEDFKLIISVPDFFEAAMDLGLLKKEGDKIYVSGTRGRFEWLEKKRQNSKKGGEANRRNFQKKRIVDVEPTNVDQGSRQAIQKESPLTLTPVITHTPAPPPASVNSISSSCSSSHETTTTTKKEINPENVKDDDVKTDNVHNTTILETSQQLFEYYSKQLMDKHGIRAFKSPKTDEQLRAIVNQFSVDDAKRLIRVYLNEKEDQVVLRSSYQLGLLTTPFGLQKYSQQIQKAKPKVDPYPNSPGPMSRVEYMAMLERNAKEQAEKEAAQAAEKAKLEAQAIEVKSGEL